MDLENKNKNEKQKINTLTIMNIEILEKIKYHKLANFTEFSKNINNYFTTFAFGFLNYIISDYYLNIMQNIWNIRNFPYVNKIFKIFNYIFILWKKYILAIAFVSWYLFTTKIFRNIEIIFIIFIINILVISYINYNLDTYFIILPYKKSYDFY